MKIELICGQIKSKFSIKQAQDILYIQKQMKTKDGWKLLENSPYEYKDNALIKRTSNTNCKEQATTKKVADGDKARRKVETSHADDT